MGIIAICNHKRGEKFRYKEKKHETMLQFFQKVSLMIDKEAYLIERLSSHYIGDDAAVVGSMLYSMDAFFEDIHFKKEWMSVEQIGRKAMLVNLSDAIAMNAKPLYALVTLSLPEWISTKEIDRLSRSLEETAQEYGCEIIGGDTIGGDKLHLSITIISTTHTPLLRKGLQEGSLLAYTGTLGESKRDLEALFKGESIDKTSRFYQPTLRQAFISKAGRLLEAGMDISDGLFCDTNKLLASNHPLFGVELLSLIDDEVGESGEEYEMLIAFSPEMREQIEHIAKETQTPLTVFAKVSLKGKQFPCKSHHFKEKVS